MSSASSWDERYRSGSPNPPEPDEILIQSERFRDDIEGGSALDVACGAGRHSLYLAGRGFHVRAVDYSPVGLELLRKSAERQGFDIETALQDLESPGTDLGSELYDLVVVVSFLYRPLMPALARCLRPGGLLVYKTYRKDPAGEGPGPRNQAYRLADGELRKAFPGLETLVYEERDLPARTAALIATKPSHAGTNRPPGASRVN